MPYDITMCPGGTCPSRQRCYRYRGIPVGRQDSFGSPPFDEASGTCTHFWDVAKLEPTEDGIRTRAYHLWLAGGRPEGDADAHWEKARGAMIAASRALLLDGLP